MNYWNFQKLFDRLEDMTHVFLNIQQELQGIRLELQKIRKGSEPAAQHDTDMKVAAAKAAESQESDEDDYDLDTDEVNEE